MFFEVGLIGEMKHFDLLLPLLIHDRYELMCECWREDPSSRPSFSELIDRLEVIMMWDVPYCDLNRHDESRPYYNVPA